MNKQRLVAALGLCSLLVSAPASAQIGRLGETFAVWAATSRGSAVGYDTRNNVYLVVSAHGTVYGRFVSADGAVLGEPFVLQAVPSFGQFPQLAYSPDANGGNGAFLVTWHESDAAIPSVHSRLVSYTHGLITGDRMLVGNDTYHEIMGAPVAYSTVSREFIVLWRQYTDTNIFGLRVNNSGDPIGAAIPVAASTVFESDPSVTYNPATDEFFAVYRQGFSPTNVMGQRIKAGTGALLGLPSVLGQSSTINTTGVTYNPVTGQYLAAWHQMPGDVVVGRVVGADGTPTGVATPISTRVGTYDSLSVDVNEVSGTVMMVGHDKWSVEVGGVEISGAGAPYTAGQALTGSGGSGNHVPKVSSNPSRREWLIVAARDFARTIAQRINTATPGGGQPPPPPPPPPPTTNPVMSLDVPAADSIVSTRFAVAGWAIDLGSQAGSGVSTVHVWARSVTTGEWAMLGAATMGVSRPDVALIFNSQNFAASGFGLSAALPPGTYDLNVFAFSVVANSFNNVATKRITVIAPPSVPRMYVDLPAVNQVVSQTFAVTGWAIDLNTASGCGVSAVHVWAYPSAGGSAMFVGAAAVGQSRPDVAAVFGNGAFATAGFYLGANLPPGEYDLVVFAFSNVAGTFNNAAVIHIRVV